MIHPDTELRFINPQVGYGVFASAFIPKGTIVYIKDSLEIEISQNDFKKCIPELRDKIERYSYIDEKGYRIVSWDIAKYVNHCCECNTISTGYGFEIAIKDILPGEQITDEYAIFNLESPITLFCDKTNCRKVVSPLDFDLYYKKWDKQIKEALIESPNVDQPLINLLDKQTLQELNRFLKNPKFYKSVYSLKYNKKITMNKTVQATGR